MKLCVLSGSHVSTMDSEPSGWNFSRQLAYTPWIGRGKHEDLNLISRRGYRKSSAKDVQ